MLAKYVEGITTLQSSFYKWDYSYQVVEDLPQALATVSFQDTQAEDNAMYVDFGATNNLTNNKGNLSDLKTYNGTDKISVGNGSRLNITHAGNTTRSSLKVNEILVVHDINKKLLSVSKLGKDNCCTLEFDESDLVVKDKKSWKQLVKGTKKRGLYVPEDNNIYALTTIWTGERQIAFGMLD
ncbi:hypothetical protein KY290_030902 [Solanum tuberosum]|uniref:Retrovirus-related Pol polyprotein from transposon TNT 1-94-like beta-barrel domain-containing protein n=1 Tax=Solanum tuberosum TaxID=4113 RepID=A0ABQ7U9J5_SOLTU|nr:hypothetical protein KY285_029982 [Solanum tuberosum]KAH0742909.1 hypothetical protein KY290_030902 [Solanum tuberosum]